LLRVFGLLAPNRVFSGITGGLSAAASTKNRPTIGLSQIGSMLASRVGTRPSACVRVCDWMPARQFHRA